MMKIFFFMFLFGLWGLAIQAQVYSSLTSEGVDNNGNYVVRIVVSTKKTPKSVDDLVKQFAVYGVMFNGVTAANEYNGQPPLIQDPNVEQTRKAWLDAFWNEGAYKRYASVTPMSLSVMKNKMTKMTEITALVVVSANSLKAYLEKEGVIQGLSNLW